LPGVRMYVSREHMHTWFEPMLIYFLAGHPWLTSCSFSLTQGRCMDYMVYL
jgi:hypothetical protein